MLVQARNGRVYTHRYTSIQVVVVAVANGRAKHGVDVPDNIRIRSMASRRRHPVNATVTMREYTLMKKQDEVGDVYNCRTC